MKVTQTITPINAEKTIMGEKVIKLELDTETGRVAINTPAMFANPTCTFEELKEAIAELDKVKELRG